MFALRLLAGIVAGVFLLLATLLLVIVAVNPTALKERITAWASTQLGRELTVKGDFTLTVVPVLSLTASGVRLANPDWASRPDMVVADRVMVELDPASLLRDTLVLPKVALDGLDVSLEQAADGRDNWQFDLDFTDDKPGLQPPSVLVELLTAPGARVRFSGPRFAAPLEVAFTTLEQRPAKDGMLAIQLVGEANGLPLQLHGLVGPTASLVAGKDIQLSIDAALGELALSTRGRVDDLAYPRATTFDFRLTGPDATLITERLGLRGLGAGAVNLTGTVAATGDRDGVQGKLAGQLGEFTVDGSGELADPENLQRLALDARIAGPDLGLLGTLAGLSGLPPEPFALQVQLKRNAGVLTVNAANLKLAAGDEVDLQGTVTHADRLTGNELRFTARGPDLARVRALLSLPGVLSGPYDIAGQLKQSPDGREVLDLKGTTRVVNFAIAGPLADYPDYYGTRLKWSASGPSLAAVGAAAGQPGWPALAFAAAGTSDWTQPGLYLRNSTLSVGRDRLTVDGLVGWQPLGQRLDLKLNLQGDDPAVLRDILGQPNLPAGPYSLAGGFRRDGAARSPLYLNAVDARLAGARLQVSGRVGNRARTLDADLKLTASGPDLSAFSKLAGQPLPRESFSLTGQVTSDSRALRISGPATLTLGKLKGQGTASIGLPSGAAPVSFDLGLRGPGLNALVPESVLSPLLAKPLDLTARGSWQQGRWAFDELRLQTDQETLVVGGTISPVRDSTTLALKVKATLRDLASTGRLFKLALPAEPLSLAASVSGTPGSLVLGDLQGESGDSDFAGRVALRSGSKPDVEVTLRAGLLDLTPLVPAPATPSGGDRLIPNIVLPVDLLNRLNGRLALKAGTVRYAGKAYGDVRLDGTLRDGQLTADRVEVTAPNGRIAGRLSLGPGGSAGPLLKVAGTGKNVILGTATGAAANQNRFDVRLDLTAQGRDTRALLGSASGTMRLISSGGQIDNRLLKNLYSDFVSQLFTTLNPLAKRQPYTQIVCAAYLFRADNGILKSDPALVLRTDTLDVIANGTTDLRTEAIDFNFKVSPRTGLGFSLGSLLNPYVKVTGTLARPRLTLDPKGTLVNGGAAFATAGLSVVATTLWDRIVHKKDPCASAVAVADARAATDP